MTAEATRRPVVGIVDDDAELRATLADLLAQNDFTPLPLASIADFMALGPAPAIDLLLIDLRLRGESGLTLALHVRERHDLPVVMLTGRGDAMDRIVGLETGADDYVTKPFNPRELMARIRAVLRRYGHGGLRPTATGSHVMPFGRFRLDMRARELLDADGQEVPLTNGEYRLLEFFARHPDRVVTRPELLADLGSDLSHYIDRTIDVLILRLRRKIEAQPSKPVHLQTRRGQGYVFVTRPPEAP